MLVLFLSRLAFFGLLLIGSCGRQNFPDYRPDPMIYETFQGNYRAEFKSLNARQVGPTKGYSVMWARGPQFYARVSLRNHIPLARHHQYVHKGKRCPDQRADKNRNGILEFDEVLEFAGKAIFPLDKKLEGRADGFGIFPFSDKNGHYAYAESTHLGKLMEDLRSYADVPNEHFCRLEYDENLNLEDRIIIVYGNGEDDLFPIACGEINIDPHPEH